MSLQCIVLKGSIRFFLPVCFLLFSFESFSQKLPFDSIAFYKHLKKEGLLWEQIVFAQKLNIAIPFNQKHTDSLLLDIGSVYFKLKMPDSCISNLKRMSASPEFSQKRNELLFSALLLCNQYESAEKNINGLQSKIFIANARTSFSILKRENISVESLDKNISSDFFDLGVRYTHTPRHSPFIAGALSAVLPGAGKWYVGYKRQAVTAFIANALFAAQAAESYVKAGVSSPQFIITGALFSIFYAGNIWGSVLAAKKKKRDYLNEIDHEIRDHYHTEFSKLSR